MERSSSVVECRTRNRESPGSNPPLLPAIDSGGNVSDLVLARNRRFPRSMRSQGKRRGCRSRQARRPRRRFRRIVVSRGNVDASLFHIKIRFFMGHQDQHGQN